MPSSNRGTNNVYFLLKVKLNLLNLVVILLDLLELLLPLLLAHLGRGAEERLLPECKVYFSQCFNHIHQLVGLNLNLLHLFNCIL